MCGMVQRAAFEVVILGFVEQVAKVFDSGHHPWRSNFTFRHGNGQKLYKVTGGSEVLG